MRSFANGARRGAVKAVSSAPRGGGGGAASVAATPSAMTAASPLPKRRTRLAIEQMRLRDVDCDRDLLGELEVQRLVRRQRRDEVRPFGDDAALARLLRLLDACSRRLDGGRVDVEVRHRHGAERLDELDACGKR